MTFPLLLSLQKHYANHPLWVVAEPQFFTPLMPLSPNVVYFPPSACDELSKRFFFRAINLSGRPEASLCLAKTKAEKKFGLSDTGQTKQVFGDWSLYRFALTQNNHHNSFHWSDLYKLDVLPNDRHGWHSPRTVSKSSRIALVIGASCASKRPDVSFWATLARKLAQNGCIPILFGGAAEKEMGEQICQLAKLPNANFCGKLKLDEVAALLRECALCITPDTGPMHLADWVGTPVLNLSMGPVHAMETGPLAPKQWILRARMSCVGCWQCNQATHKCKAKFHAPQIAQIVLALLKDPQSVHKVCPHGLELLQSGRDEHGLYRLTSRTHVQTCREILNDFWRSAFLVFSGQAERSALHEQYATLCRTQPRVAKGIANALEQLIHTCSQCLKEKRTLHEHVWRQSPLLTRFFTGYTHMLLQNANWEKQAWLKAMERMDLLLSCTSKS